MSEDLKKLEEAIVELEKKPALELTKKILEEKKATANDAVGAITQALNKIGELYEAEEYYLAELVYAGDVAKSIMKLLGPHLEVETGGEKDMQKIIVMGTVKGDMHDLGKNIVGTFAEGAGYEVFDLGTDVSAEAFIDKLKETNAKILGLSCLLTACDYELNNILAALKKEGLTETKVVIGGAAITEKLANDLATESGMTTRFAPDAITGIRIFNELID